LGRIRADIDNVRNGWDWAVEQQQVDQIDKGLDGICSYYDWLSLYQDGTEMCQDALDCLATLKSGTARQVTARLLTYQSVFYRYLSQYGHAVQLAIQSFELLKECTLNNQDMLTEKAFILGWIGALGWGEVEIEKIGNPREFLEESISIYRQLNKTDKLAWAIQHLGIYFKYDTKNDLAKLAFEESMTLFMKIGDKVGTADILMDLSNLSLVTGDLEYAEKIAQESVAICRSLEQAFLLAHALLNLGWVLYWTGKFREGIIALEESCAIFKNLGDDYRTTVVLSRQAICQMASGNYEKALEKIESIIHEKKEKYFFVYGICLMIRGMFLFAEGENEAAEECLNESIIFCEEMNLVLIGGLMLILLGILNVGSGKFQQAQKNIHEALRIGEEIGAYYILVHAIPAAAYLIAYQGEAALAIEIYELAKQKAFVKNSRWFEDTIGHKIDAICNDLPKKVVKDAKRRGRTRDEGATVIELLKILDRDLQSIAVTA